MSPAHAIADWIREHDPALVDTGEVAVVAHRRPAKLGRQDALIVAVERQDDGYLFGGGLGPRDDGRASIRMALWYVVNTRRPARDPEAAITALQPVYDALVDTRRTQIGPLYVRHVEAGLGPMLRDVDAADEVAAYARVSLDVEAIP